MQSQLGSHHDPSPEDSHRAFISPEAFDTSMGRFSPRPGDAPGSQPGAKSSSTGPFIATSTPIMDDSVQTDPSPSVRDMHVQVSDDLGLDSSSTTSSHRKSERRRRRNKSPLGSRSPSTSPDPGRKASRASKKSSRRSSRRSESLSQQSGTRASEEKDVLLAKEKKSRSTSREKTVERDDSPLKDGNHAPNESSDALLDTTLVDEKFSELENVAVQSSETDAREEDLGSGEMDQEKSRRRKRSKSRTPVATEEPIQIGETEGEKKSDEGSSSRPDSRKEQSILKSRNNSAKRSSVSWQDETDGKQEIVDGESNEMGKTEPDVEEEEDTNNESKSDSKDTGEDNIESKPSEEAATSDKSDGSLKKEESKGEDYLEEIETGKLINLQEAAAARRRSRDSQSVSRERSVDLSDASSRSAHKHCFDKPGGKNRGSKHSSSSSTNTKNARSPNKMKSTSPARTKMPTTSEEREIFLQEQILAGKRIVGAVPRGASRRSSRGHETGGDYRDSGFSDQTMMMNTSAEEQHARKGTKTSSSVSMKRRYTTTTRRPGSSSATATTTMKRKSIFSSSAKKVKPPRDRNRFNNSVTVNQLMLQQQQAEMMLLGMGLDGEDDSTSTRGDSITSGDDYLDQNGGDRRSRRKGVGTRPRSKLGPFGHEDTTDNRLSPRPMKKSVNVDTPISVTQAMQASMRK